MTAPSIDLRPASSLAPYARNSRTHSERQVSQLVASLEEFGMVGAIVVRDGVIAKGHGTLQAIQSIYKAGRQLYPAPGRHDGAEPYPSGMVPVIDCSGWSESRFKAYVIADNRLALDAGWNEDLLALEIGDLITDAFDVTLLGFTDKELAALTAPPATEGLTDPDDIPVTPQEPASEFGDVWILGRHRLVCGDSTDPDAVAKALNGVSPQLMVTDPPCDGKQAGRAVGKVLNDDKADWREAWALFPGDVAYVWHASMFTPEVVASLEACGFERRCFIIWAKSNFAIGRGHYHWQHEPCAYMVKKGGTGHWNGDRKQTTLWQIDKPQKSETGHSTQKPVECMARPIRNNSSPGQAVYEPFAGSFTTGIACEMEGRSCHAIELSPAFVDVGVTRWEKFTGKQAILEETGETFLQVLARRRPNAHIDAKKGE